MIKQILFAPNCYLHYDTVTGDTKTVWPKDSRWSGCLPIPEDEYHAKRLGITDKLHRFEHEYVHHLIGIHYYKQPWSPIIYRDAYHIPQPEHESMIEEWLVTAMQYFFHDHDATDFGAILDISKVANVFEIKNQIKKVGLL